MNPDVMTGVNGVLAGVTLCAGLASLGIWLSDRNVRWFLTIALMSVAMAVQFVSGSSVLAASDDRALRTALFIRSVASMIVVILAVHSLGQLDKRLPTRWIVRTMAAFALLRIVLWWPTDLILVDPLPADGRNVFATLGWTWLAFPLGLLAASVLLVVRTTGIARVSIVGGGVVLLALWFVPGFVDDRVTFEELVTLNAVPGGVLVLVLAARTMLVRDRTRETIARRQRLITEVSRASVDMPLDALRHMAERQIALELDTPGVAIAVRERDATSQHDLGHHGRAIGRRQCADITGLDDVTGSRGEYVNTLLRIVASTADRVAADTEFAHRAVHDDLTGLPTTTLLRSRLDDRLLAGSPSDVLLVACRVGRLGRRVATEGLTRSEELLVETARALSRLRRPSTTLARMSTDTFVVLENLPADDPDGYVVTRLTQLRDRAEVAADTVVHVGAVVGRTGSTADSMLRDAVTAVERSRAEHRTVVFDEMLAAQLHQRVELERDLGRALRRHQMDVRYQPVLDAQTHEVVGFEALTRWRRNGVVIPPTTWVPLAERSGLIHDIGRYVLSVAAGQQSRLCAPVAVNVSPLELLEEHFVDDVVDAIGDCPPELVVLEITESAMMSDLDRSIAVLEQLRALGIRIALDDFGSSYSSLGALADLPVDILKLDRSFVTRLGTPGGRAVVQSIVALGRALDKPVVAEGVETETQLAVLAELGVDRVQGYLLGRPAGASRIASGKARPVPGYSSSVR